MSKHTFSTCRPRGRLNFSFLPISLLLLSLSVNCLPVLAQQCGSQASGATCVSNLCCSQYGYCGSTTAYCGTGCQSGPCSGGSRKPPTSPPPAPCSLNFQANPTVCSIISPCVFDRFLPQHNSSSCPAQGFYTREAFLSAASAFRVFGTTGSPVVWKQELAAFFANVAHETGRGCYVEEIIKDTYCDPTSAPCAPGQQYYGRGPIQLSWNYNYQAAGKALGFDGINNPGIVASNATLSFKTAVWYWMTRQTLTCHAAMVTSKGFGATIRAINGGLECGPSANKAEQQDRINLYKSFCSILGVHPGSNLAC